MPTLLCPTGAFFYFFLTRVMCISVIALYLKKYVIVSKLLLKQLTALFDFFVTDLYTTSDSTTLDDNSNKTDIKQAEEIGEMTRRLQEETVRERMVHG